MLTPNAAHAYRGRAHVTLDLFGTADYPYTTGSGGPLESQQVVAPCRARYRLLDQALSARSRRSGFVPCGAECLHLGNRDGALVIARIGLVIPSAVGALGGLDDSDRERELLLELILNFSLFKA